MPSAHGHNNSIMEKQKSAKSISSAQWGGESSAFICTECGEGFSQYSSVLAHMAVHGPLDSFSFDGSSTGFEVPREYVLQENGTLIVVNGFAQGHSYGKAVSPGVMPSHVSSPNKPLSPHPRPQSHYWDILRPRSSDMDRSRHGHYRCEICNRSFNTLQSLHRHQQYRNTERGYKCTLCCKIFESRHQLKIHLQVHAHEQFHSCSQCGKRFLKVDALNAHQEENHLNSSTLAVGRSDNQEKKLEKIYKCQKCKLNFFWISDFQTHSQHHCKGKETDFMFTSEIEIEVNSKDFDMALENGDINGNGPSIDEKNVDKVFGENENKIETEHSFTPYRCGLCGDRFQKLTALKEHHLTHQTQEEIDKMNEVTEITLKPKISPKPRRRRGSNPNGKLHPCKHCHRVFNHSSSLSRHMRYHKGTMHTCVFCGRHFPQRCDMRRHIAMYHKTEVEKKQSLKQSPPSPQNRPPVDEEKISLDNKARSSSDSEQMPEEQDQLGKQSGKSGRVNYKCQECGKRFGLLCVYQRHLRYHKKEPGMDLNKCPQCPAQFRNSSSLELHLQNHPTSEKAVADYQESHATDISEDPALEKSHRDDMEEDSLDRSPNDKENSSEVLYECTECTEIFSCLETFLQHQIGHGSESNG